MGRIDSWGGHSALDNGTLLVQNQAQRLADSPYVTKNSRGENRKEVVVSHLALMGNFGLSGDMHKMRCRLSLTQSMKYCFMLSQVSSCPGRDCKQK